MRHAAFLILILCAAGCDRRSSITYYDKNAKETPSREEAVFYSKVESLGNGRFFMRHFWTADNTKKLEAECHQETNEKTGKDKYIFDRFVTQYKKGGRIWYQMLLTDEAPKFIQCWSNGEPQLVNGTGIMQDSTDGYLGITEVRDSVAVILLQVSFDTQNSLYTQPEILPVYDHHNGDLQFEFDLRKELGQIDKGKETGAFVVEFTVDKLGAVSDINVMDGGIGPITTKWIETNLQSIGAWKPGTVHGKPVKSRRSAIAPLG